MYSVLVVDDEEAMREFYRRALASEGHRVIDVRTAEEALDYLALTPDIRVAVIDLNMPGQGGAWLIAQMRERFPNVAAILATANPEVPGTLSLQPSVFGYLVKPISAQQLLAAVADALAARSQPAAAAGGGGDPYDAWLNRKLTHRPADADDSSK